MASTIHLLNDTSELVEFYKPMNLYLKPIARLNITVQLPQLKEPGKIISNWDIMEKIKRLIKPSQFSSIKVSKSTIEFVRFEAELDNRESLKKTIKALDGNNLKMIGFFEPFKVKACEAKLDFPTRHDWDSFFRDAKNMDEMKAGERPDTLYLGHLPTKWFVEIRQRPSTASKNTDHLPSENLLRRLFETFGEVRCVDIPAADSYRPKMTKSKNGIRMNNSGCVGFINANFTEGTSTASSSSTSAFGAVATGQDLTFEAYVQFVEYISFVRAMDCLRGMKLVYMEKDEKRALAANIKVDFDRTKHLSDKNIRKRRLEREQLVAIDRQREEQRRRAEEEEARRREEERRALELAQSEAERARIERRRAREEKRRIKQLEMKRKKAADAIERRIRLEEHKLLLAQRKLESVRLLTELFRRCQVIEQKRQVERSLKELEEAQRREAMERERLARQEEETRTRLLKKMEEKLRHKVVRSMHEMEDKQHFHKREQVCKALHESGTVLRSVATEITSSLASRRSLTDDIDDRASASKRLRLSS